jgi:hypothetical protein
VRSELQQPLMARLSLFSQSFIECALQSIDTSQLRSADESLTLSP